MTSWMWQPIESNRWSSFVEYVFNRHIHLYISNLTAPIVTILVTSGYLPCGSIYNYCLHAHNDATWKIIGWQQWAQQINQTSYFCNYD